MLGRGMLALCRAREGALGSEKERLAINELACCSELYPSSWSVLCSAWLCISSDLCVTEF